MKLITDYRAIFNTVRGHSDVAVLFLENNSSSEMSNLAKVYLEKIIDINLYVCTDLHKGLNYISDNSKLKYCVVVDSSILVKGINRVFEQIEKIHNNMILIDFSINNRNEIDLDKRIFGVNLEKYKHSRILDFSDIAKLDFDNYISIDENVKYFECLEQIKISSKYSDEMFHVFDEIDYSEILKTMPKQDKKKPMHGMIFFDNDIMYNLFLMSYYNCSEYTLLYFYGSRLFNTFCNYMFKNWDGYNLEQFLNNTIQDLNLDERYIFRRKSDNNSINSRWQYMLRHFGGSDNWIKLWNSIRKCNIRYKPLSDVFFLNNDSLFERLDYLESPVLSLGKVYESTLVHFWQTDVAVRTLFNNLLFKINNANHKTILYGTDPFSNSFAGHRVGNIYSDYTSMQNPRYLKWTNIT